MSLHDQQAGAKTDGATPRKWGLTLVPLGIFVALAVMFGFSLVAGDPSKLPSALIGKPAPAFTVTPLVGLTANGQQVPSFDQAALKTGGPTVVNFWASWCVPCVQEHPLLVDMQERTGVRIFGVQYKDSPSAGLKFLARLGNPYQAVGRDTDGRAAIEWGVYGMPETFIVNANGEIIYKHVGAITPEVLNDRLIPIVEREMTAAKSS